MNSVDSKVYSESCDRSDSIVTASVAESHGDLDPPPAPWQLLHRKDAAVQGTIESLAS